MNLATLAYLVTPSGKVWLAPKNKKIGVGLLFGYGGKVETDETIIQAALREIRQESLVEVTSRDLVHMTVIDFLKEREHMFQCHIFLVTRWAVEPKETEEMGIPELHARNNLPLNRMLPGDAIWLPEVMKGRIIPQGGFIRHNEDMTRVIDSHIPSPV